MNMRINTGSCAAVCLKEEISHRRKSGTKAECYKVFTESCLPGSAWNRIWMGYWENLCMDDLSQHQKRQWSFLLRSGRTWNKPQRLCFPHLSEHRVSSCVLPVWASRAFPLWYQGTVTFQPVSDWQERDFKGPVFCKTKGHMELLRDDVTDLQLIFACCLFPMVAHFHPSRV